MLLIKLLRKLIKALSSGATPTQLAAGFVMGMWLGITPFWTMLNFLILIAVILINVNIGMAILGFLIFSAVGLPLDPVFHDIGYYLLVQLEFMNGFWTVVTNLPVVSLMRINNTTFLGSFIGAVILTVPSYYFARWFVFYYRQKIEPVVLKFKIVRVIKSSKIYSVYERINLGRD